MRRGPLLLFLLGCFGQAEGCDDSSYRLGGGPENQSGRGGFSTGGTTAIAGRSGFSAGGTTGVAGRGGFASGGTTAVAGGAGTIGNRGSGGLAGGSSVGGSGNAGSAGYGGGSAPTGGMGGVGGGPITGMPLTADVRQIVSDVHGAAWVVADESYVFFSYMGGPVFRADHRGGDLLQMTEGPSYYLAMDETHVYWSTSVDVRRLAKSNGGGEELVTTSRSFSSNLPAAIWLTFDASYVYWSTFSYESPASVLRAPKTGGPPQVMASADDVMGGVAVSQDTLFWGDLGVDGRVHRTDVNTGVTSQFHPARAATMRVVGDDLWFREMGNGFDAGWLVRVPLVGGEPMAYSAPGRTFLFESDGLHVYWVFDHLKRLNVQSSVEELVALLPAVDPVAVAVTRDWLFVSDAGAGGGIFRVAKPAP